MFIIHKKAPEIKFRGYVITAYYRLLYNSQLITLIPGMGIYNLLEKRKFL